MVLAYENSYDNTFGKIHKPKNLSDNMLLNDQDEKNENGLPIDKPQNLSVSPRVTKENLISSYTSIPEQEIIELPFTKTKAWISDKPEDSMNLDKFKDEEMPIPKPRKKWAEREKNKDKLIYAVPDLTLNHSMSGNKNLVQDKEISSVTNEYLIRETGNIPDIIASQIKRPLETFIPENVETIDLQNSAHESDNNSKNIIFQGEIYHVVLDKKSGSLGLNIYQGTDLPSSQQRHIYVHSVISGGTAALDGRIKPGDKLLEVNGINLENLPYQEVVSQLRESPQFIHLVLEKGNCDITKYPNNENIPKNSDSITDSCLIYKDYYNIHDNDLDINREINNSRFKIPFSLVNSYGNTYIDNPNTCSSLPEFNDSSELATVCAKESNSAPSSYQYNNFSKSDISINNTGVTFSSPYYAKVFKHQRFQDTLSSYKSSPNLTESLDEYENNKDTHNLYRNMSTECLSTPKFFNPHLALLDLYQNYAFIRGSSDNNHRIPALPIRRKKLKKLEDVFNYCNSENTFTVDLRKSSRGLGLSICGGRETSSRDSFRHLIWIRKLYPLQPALECGKLSVGDVILEVNGISTLRLTNTEALELLRTAPSEVTLKIFRPSKSIIPSFSLYKEGVFPLFDSSSCSTSSSHSQIDKSVSHLEQKEFEVTLIKRGGSLGFTIVKKDAITSECDSEGIYVKALIREPAISDGRILPGDKLLQVNGMSISTMSHAEAITYIRNAPNKVTLKISRADHLYSSIFEKDLPINKPLRWEAIELLNDRVKHKDNNNDSHTIKKIKRKLGKSNAPSNSSTESESTSSSEQEHIINENPESEKFNCPGLQRNLRPKSLDVLNSSDRKYFSPLANEESFHRQASVVCSIGDKNKIEDCDSHSLTKTNGTTLLKWRGTTFPDSEESNNSEINHEAKTDSPSMQLSDNNSNDDEKPIPYPRTTSISSNDKIHVFNVELNRGWHGRLGFRLSDPSPTSSHPLSMHLPKSAEVIQIFPGSLADRDGRIHVGDRLIQVNHECLINKPASEIIDILRKTRGLIRMIFCRLNKPI